MNAALVAGVVAELTTTTSLAFCGMFIREASRSRPTCESGLLTKLYCAVSAPGSSAPIVTTATTSKPAHTPIERQGCVAAKRAMVWGEILRLMVRHLVRVATPASLAQWRPRSGGLQSCMPGAFPDTARP